MIDMNTKGFTPDQIRFLQQSCCGKPMDCGSPACPPPSPSPSQCRNCQQLVDIIGNLVAVLRERPQSGQR